MRDKFDSANCSKYLKALADPERLKIVQCLQDGPKPVGEISRQLELPIAGVSHHLKQLRHAGLVRNQKQGRFVIYELEPAIIADRGVGGLKVLDFRCCRVELGKK